MGLQVLLLKKCETDMNGLMFECEEHLKKHHVTNNNVTNHHVTKCYTGRRDLYVGFIEKLC
jgi:hypothetical protein